MVGSEEGGKEGGTLKQLTALLEVKRPPLLHLSAQLLSYILALGFTAPYWRSQRRQGFVTPYTNHTMPLNMVGTRPPRGGAPGGRSPPYREVER